MTPSKIEWCDETVNPQGWGCWGPGGTPEEPRRCWYCYSDDFAARNLSDCPLCNLFIPHWHPERLVKPLGWKRPKKIFWGSMSDIFHPCTPDHQIRAILDVVYETPRHTHIFCTKNPRRYRDFGRWPDNCILLTTITGQGDERQRIWDLLEARANILGLSLEPLSYPIDLTRLCRPLFPYPGKEFPAAFVLGSVLGDTPGNIFSPRLAKGKGINLLIIGALSGRDAKKHRPDPAWVQSLIDQARAAKVPVFVKGELFKQFPIQEWPQ